MLWWLSFADSRLPKNRQFLGAAVVEAPSFLEAVLKAYKLKINPGGEVKAVEIPPEKMGEFIPYEDQLIPPDVAIEKWAPDRKPH